MDDIVRVHVLQHVGQLPGEVDREANIQRGSVGEELAEVLAVDELEDEVWRDAVVEPSVGQEALDPRMVQTLADVELALIAAVGRRIADHAGVRDLDDDRLAGLTVARFVRLAHAALAEGLQDLMAMVERLTGGEAHAADLSGAHPLTPHGRVPPRLNIPESQPMRDGAGSSSGAAVSTCTISMLALSGQPRASTRSISSRHASAGEQSPTTSPSSTSASSHPRPSLHRTNRAPRMIAWRT